MPRIAIDSTALILLAKCSLIETFCELFEVIAPEAVINEVASEELVTSYPDASLITELRMKGAIKVQHVGRSDKLTSPFSLHEGEEDALLLAVKLGRSLFATDDGKAIKAARFLKVPFIVTPRLGSMGVLEPIEI